MTDIKISVEIAKPDDCEALVNVLNQALATKLSLGDQAWGDRPYTQDEVMTGIKAEQRYKVLIGEVLGATVKLLSNDERVWGEQKEDALYVHQLAVADKFRGMGVGAKILDWVDSKARSDGINFVRLDFPPSNDGLKKYYESLGFERVRDAEVEAGKETYLASLYQRKV